MTTRPEVECIGCGRGVACAVMRDGTVYRPVAWRYTDQSLRGTCGDCQSRQAAKAFLELATAMHEADPSKPTSEIVEAATAAVLSGTEGT